MSTVERRWKRVKVNIRVRIRGWDEPEEANVVVRTYELSEGGMSVYASDTLEVGRFVSVEFSVPNSDEPIRLKAVVRNRRGFRCGLEFIDISSDASSEILRYLGATEGV